MKYNLVAVLALVFVSVQSCKRDDLTTEGDYSVVDLSQSAGLASSEEAIGVYSGWNTLSNNLVRLHGTNTTNFNSKTISFSYYFYASAYENVNIGPVPQIDVGDFNIDNRQVISFNPEIEKYDSRHITADEKILLFQEIQGKNMEISLEKEGSESVTRQFNVSNAIIISDLFERQYNNTNLAQYNRNDFVINYNADPRNKNGILVKFYYRGELTSTTMDDLQNTNHSTEEIVRGLYVKNEPQNGKLKIPSELFDGLPSGAIFTMYFRRNSGELFEQDGKTFNYSVSFDHKFDVVLF